MRVMPSLMEVDEQAQALAGKPEIGQKLLLVDWSDQLDGFDFDYNLVFDEQIGSESGVDTYILVYHRNWLLAHRARPRRPSSYAKTVPIPANLGQASYECGKRCRQSP
jgi:hypothetical protein